MKRAMRSACPCPFHDRMRRTIIWLCVIGIVCASGVILNVVVLVRLYAHGL